MKKSIISVIIWLCIILMLWVYYIISNSTIETKTTTVNSDGTPVKQENVKVEKEVKKETKKDDDKNTQYLIHTTEANIVTGEVGYWIFTPDWEKIWNIDDIYWYSEKSHTWEIYKNLLFIDNWRNQYIFNPFSKSLWTMNLPRNTQVKAFANKINNKLYFILSINEDKYTDLWNKKLYDAYWNSYTIFRKFLSFIDWNIILEDNMWKKILLSEDLKPLTKNLFDGFTKYSTKYKSKDLILYSFEINHKYYIKYLYNNILTDIQDNSQWFEFKPDFSIYNDKLYFFDNENIKYYTLSLDNSNEIKIWNLNTEKIPFDINVINLDVNWKKYTSKTLKWLWEYNWEKIYKYAFGFERRSCSLFWCDNYMEYDDKFLNSHWKNINNGWENLLYEKLLVDYSSCISDINKALNWDVNVCGDINFIELHKTYNFWGMVNYIWLYDNSYKVLSNEFKLWNNNFKIESWLDTESIKNNNWEIVLSGINEIKWIIENEYIINLKINNKDCLYKEISWKFIEYYCSDKWILLYKNWYILEWVWYSWDFWELRKENWVMKFKKVDFLDKSWKKIIISEFNSNQEKLLFVDNQNNFYLFQYINMSELWVWISKPVKELLYSWKREWRDDLELFLIDKNILKDSILK